MACCWLCFVIAGCDAPQHDNTHSPSYFPLHKGLSWKYRVTTELSDGRPHVTTLRIDNKGKETFGQQDFMLRRTSHGTDYYLRQDSNGIFRYAKRTIIQTSPVLDATPRMVLPLPVPDKPGKSWSVLTQSYTLHRVLPNYEPPYENIAHFHMTYSIVGLDEAVTVPAGDFQHCLLVEGQAQIDQHAGANEGTGIIEITTREWYAPGVGMVKMERMEPLDGSVFKGGKVLIEMVELSGF